MQQHHQLLIYHSLIQFPSRTTSDSPSAFFGAKTLTAVPVQVVQTVLFGAVVYWMIGCKQGSSTGHGLGPSAHKHICNGLRV